jgi:hypothetical protein
MPEIASTSDDAVPFPQHAPPELPQSQIRPDKLSLSLTQVVGSVMAAMSATVAASYFGVAGTVIGAALGSLITVVGGALYTHSLRRTRQAIRAAAIESAVGHRFATVTPVAAAPPTTRTSNRKPSRRAIWRELPLRTLALCALILFAGIIGAVTVFEVASGKPLSSTVTGTQGSGTTVGGGQDGGHRLTPKVPAVTPSTAGTASPATHGAAATTGSAATVTSASATSQPSEAPSQPTGTPTPTDTSPTPSAPESSDTSPTSTSSPTAVAGSATGTAG